MLPGRPPSHPGCRRVCSVGMEFVEPDDELGPFRSPPSPDDRLWRHPSEVAVKRQWPRRQLLVVGVTSALAAGLLSTGLAVVVGSLVNSAHSGSRSGGQDPRPAPLQNSVLPLTASSGPRASAVQIAERARPAIAALKIGKGSGASGTGVIFRSDGHLLTNAHVVEGSTSLTVVLSSGRELPGRVIGVDANSDTAVVKIDGGPFLVAELGTAGDLKVGQETFAVGSPMGPGGEPTVTVGVVAALHRTVRTRNASSWLVDMVQTDAPVAPASSGGALLDASGRLIGIATEVAVNESGNEGSGFAVPIDMARSSAEQLISTGRVTNVWMGVECSDLDDTTAVELHVDGGTMVERVRVGSPAERAGLAPSDVIVGLDGRPVTSLGMLLAVLRAHHPGDVVDLDVVRDKQRRAMKVTVAERPSGS